MKKSLSGLMKILFSSFFLLIFIEMSAQTAPAIGDGSTGNPYQIATLENLVWLSQIDSVWDEHFIQTADIDADTLSAWSPIGNNTVKFSGSYDGQNYAISNMTINMPSSNYVGLFGYAWGTSNSNLAVIRNLKLIDFDVTGYDYTATLCSYPARTQIYNIIASGNVAGNNQTGGLIGRHYGQGINYKVELSYSSFTGTVSGNTWVGGLIGANEGNSSGYAMVEKCFSNADVSGISYVGGFAGINSGASSGHDTIRNCYSMGTVTRISGTNDGVGAFIGRNNAGYIENCYSVDSVFFATVVTNKGFVGDEFDPGTYVSNFFDSTASNQSTAIGATPKTTQEMNSTCTFRSAGWDLVDETANGTEDIWDIDAVNNHGYPFLGFEDPLITPVYQSAVNFDGSSDQIYVASYSAIDLINNYTLECWFKVDSLVHFGGLISKYHSSGSNGYTLRLSSNAPYTGLNFDEMTTANGILTAGTWYHVAAVNDNGTRHLYLNGEEQVLTGTPFNTVHNSDNLYMGVDYMPSGRYFNGDIDEVRIWDTVRTVCEIQGYMNTELSGTENHLVAYFNFNEGIPYINTSCLSHSATNLTGNTNGVFGNGGIAFIDSTSNYVLSGATLNGTGIYSNNISPVIMSSHNDQHFYLDTTCSYTLQSFLDSIVASDNCDSVIYSQNPAAGSVLPTDTTIVWLYASDLYGNIDSVWFYAIVSDAIAPEVICIGNQIISLAQGETYYTIQGNEFDANASDNCSVDTIFNSLNSSSTLGNEQLNFGTHIITWYAMDASGNLDSCSFEVIVSLFDAINESSSNLTVYPNPADNYTKISADKTIQHIEIYDLSGRLIYNEEINTVTDQINTTDFASGTYLMKVFLTENTEEIILVIE
ncbi:MAG: T9SS type A sorting domain-containing protein [Bacteroidales bacterium]|nr:T9SS type A sorting domain-containing protein [Bacteroidales bacterium]